MPTIQQERDISLILRPSDALPTASNIYNTRAALAYLMFTIGHIEQINYLKLGVIYKIIRSPWNYIALACLSNLSGPPRKYGSDFWGTYPFPIRRTSHDDRLLNSSREISHAT